MRERSDRERLELLLLWGDTDGVKRRGAEVCGLGATCGVNRDRLERKEVEGLELRDEDICCLADGVEVERERLTVGRLD